VNRKSIFDVCGANGWIIALRDEKNIYLAHFGSQENLWSGRARLMVMTVATEP
jgi:hypothetical protein